jgi:glyoxylase-like metal-dependent hydrolase (beta-lactamase superfamily II)
MKLTQRTERLYELNMGYVKAFLIEGEDHLVLIDTGTAGNARKILDAIDIAGLDSKRLKHIIVTHLHKDHTGSLSDLKDITGAAVYAHEEEASDIEAGIVLRPFTPSPRFPANILVPLLSGNTEEKQKEGCKVDIKLKGDELLNIGGGIQIIATPGHTKGHICCILPQEKILIAGDVGSGGRKPTYPLLFEDMETGLKSLKSLGKMDLNTAYFSHGKTIKDDASRKFREQF